MAVIEFPPQGAPYGEGATECMPTSHEAQPLEPLHPLETREGVLILEKTPLPTFPDIGIENITTRRRNDMDTGNGSYYQRDLTYSDGTQRREYVGLARNANSTVPIAKKPAWWTSNSKGFNKATTDKFHANGRHTITEGIALNKAHSLYRNVWDVHLALTEAGDEFGHILQTEVIDVEGDSNGAMEGTGVIAYAPEFDRTVREGYLVDPCIVRKIGLIDAKKFLRHPDYFVREVYCLGKQAVRLARDEEESARDYVGTIEFSKEFLVANFLLARGLFWGEFGHVLAHVPPNQQGHFQLFEFSIANQKGELLKVLRGSSGLARQRMTTSTVTGTHMSIANPRTMQGKINYLVQADEAAA